MSEPAPIYDPASLREVFPNADEARRYVDRLRADIRAASDETAELLVRGELVDALRILDQLDDALTEADRAVERAELVGTPAQQHLARLRLGRVRHRRGDFGDANLLATELLHAGSQFGPVIYAFTEQFAGENAFDQGHFTEASEHFTEALRVRRELQLPDEQIAASQAGLDAARAQQRRNS